MLHQVLRRLGLCHPERTNKQDRTAAWMERSAIWVYGATTPGLRLRRNRSRGM